LGHSTVKPRQKFSKQLHNKALDTRIGFAKRAAAFYNFF